MSNDMGNKTITMTIWEYCVYVKENNLEPVESHKTRPGEKIWFERGPKNRMGAHIMVRGKVS